jgi:hypothetical protein
MYIWISIPMNPNFTRQHVMASFKLNYFSYFQSSRLDFGTETTARSPLLNGNNSFYLMAIGFVSEAQRYCRVSA